MDLVLSSALSKITRENAVSRQIAARSTAPAPRWSGNNVWIVLGGIVAIAAVGWLLAFPLMAGEAFSRQVIGTALDAPWRPFGDDRDGKTGVMALIFIFIGIPLLLLGFWIGRVIRRRLGLHGTLATVQLLVSLLLLLTPFLLARSGVLGIDTMLGSGWLW